LKAAGENISLALKSQHLPPDTLLKSIPVADVNSIGFKTFAYFNKTSQNQPEGFDLKSIPFPFYLDDMKSQFVRVQLFLDTSKMSVDDSSYLVLLTELWLQSPLKHPDTGEVETLQELIAKRSAVLVSLKNNLGYDGSKFSPGTYSHLLMFNVEATIEKYSEAIHILRDTLFNVDFTEERVRTVISQLLNGIPGDKLSAATVVKTLADNMYFNDKNNIHFSSFLRQQKFLNASLQLLKDDPTKLIRKLSAIREALVTPANCMAFVSVELSRLQLVVGKDGAEVWKNFFPETSPSINLLRRDVSKEIEIIPEYFNRNKFPNLRHAIIGLPGKKFENIIILSWEVKN